MKFENKERKLVSSQKTMAIELGLADQKKAIELLYSQYRKPIQTCVQELVCNAFDAMQDAGKSHVPIKVQLPNELNDFYFSVRDYGNSMDDDAIKNVYMRVNAPTNVKKFDNLSGYRTLEEAVDLCAIKELYVNDVVSDLLYKLERENLTYVLPFLTESKRKLHIKVDKRYRFSSYGLDSMTVKKLYETFGSSIDKEIKTLVKKRVRLCNIVDTMPLLSYVNVRDLSQVAKKDLNDYINQRIGA